MPRKTATPASKAGKRGKDSDDWQSAALDQVRALIRAADPAVVEEPKWRKPTNPDGVPVWSHDGIICTGETYKSHVRLTFARGAALKDPDRLFNSGFDGHTLRAIVLHEGEKLDGPAFKALIREAATLNAAGGR
jgi:hypothetical protein